MLKQTPSQTVGPYFAYGLTPEQYLYDFKSLAQNELVSIDDNPITIKGKVFDGEGNVIPDAMLEIWDNQNNLFGRFGTGTEKDHSFVFKTAKPKPIGTNAPFLSVILFMRGQLIHSYTRIYFSDEENNDSDEALKLVPVERKNTLVAQKKENYYHFDIHMQGENETVFFDI
ncbi:protocatechuate 3,4-dioxygenase subunit alpha [Lacihabitans soyangensis]|uniref:Protocatechuate 3,4-dioxygenase subunit alpha n=1 Tax=Lacihabitans soyangensis TaxID=869394 RepID=A0AAE3GYG9_9BACT|nr:protocatechuate 3,4-dioxygenase subunit alpha [Lacihabitans soyangensis]MCP9761563.1 protocatechuate 3,4-dioxygenase subunit alpha [Lacihabitans soyangensis]